jgi:hypothetical protein
MQRQGFRVTEKSTRRQHDSEQEIDDLVARFDDLALPKREWTHFAHLTVGFCSLERFGLTASRLLLPDRIRRYNVASSTPNTDSGGYHDTITMVFLAAAARFRSQLPPGTPRLVAINLLIEDPLGAKDLPLAFYTRDRLMSVAARRAYVEPDLQPIEALETIESVATPGRLFT